MKRIGFQKFFTKNIYFYKVLSERNIIWALIKNNYKKNLFISFLKNLQIYIQDNVEFTFDFAHLRRNPTDLNIIINMRANHIK